MTLLLFLLSALFAGLTRAFPAFERYSNDEKYAELLKRAATSRPGGKSILKTRAPPSTNPSTNNTGFEHRSFQAIINPDSFPFNLKEQTVDLTSDEHKFIPPTSSDIRGPCPGLNLLANHGYLNRNGVTTLTQGIDAINKVFGVGLDLALALNAYAVVFNGNILDLTWSIGGTYGSSSLGALTNILVGQPSGINAHNIYEGDASIVRRDYYDPDADHDNVLLHMPYFEDLLALGNHDSTPGKDVYNSDLMLQHKSNRWHQSVATNPYFFNSAFGGLVVTTAAERFVAEFAANNTVDPDTGLNRIYLDEPNLLAFFAVNKSQDGTLTYTPGHERLLPSWKRRPLAATFDLTDIVATLIRAASIDPSLLSVGGNAGKVNTFTGVDVGNLTGAVYNFDTLVQDPQALACYLYQIGIEQVVPTQLQAIYKVTAEALDFVAENLAAPFKALATSNGTTSCDSFKSSVVDAYRSYPGAKIERENSTGILGSLLG